MAKRTEVQEKYQFARNILGLPRSSPDGIDANHVKNWSWDRIAREFAERLPDERRQATSFMNRRFEGQSGRDVYWQKYRLLRSSGMNDKQARRHASYSTEYVQATIARKDWEGMGSVAGWDYLPHDMGYSQPFVYKIGYREVDPETESPLEIKWVTIVSHKELDPETVENIVFDLAENEYGTEIEGGLDSWNVVPMKAGV